LTPKTKAVMVVHMGGLAADVTALRSALPPHVAIVEDAAHALGSRYASGATVGSLGNPTCFSFYANKNLSTGEGGAVAVSDVAVATRIRSLRQHGLSSDAWKRYTHPQNALSFRIEELGYKMNYTDLQASIGRVQLQRQSEFAAHRLAIAERYRTRLADCPLPLPFQHHATHRDHARHLLVTLLPIEQMQSTRNETLMALRRRNIGAAIHYVPLHRESVYADAVRAPLPTTEWLADRIMTLPISVSMTLDDVDEVCDHLNEVLAMPRARLAS